MSLEELFRAVDDFRPFCRFGIANSNIHNQHPKDPGP